MLYSSSTLASIFTTPASIMIANLQFSYAAPLYEAFTSDTKRQKTLQRSKTKGRKYKKTKQRVSRAVDWSTLQPPCLDETRDDVPATDDDAGLGCRSENWAASGMLHAGYGMIGITSGITCGFVGKDEEIRFLRIVLGRGTGK
ncbi:hypothetical protein LZ554_007223 [Drepanopeziza brunnea f. sp. 'monogermtubi']|nr:hypothetical protein LZ554_007223 [Drepanopeziza brunnea f. sp. 'monogermtubi']